MEKWRSVVGFEGFYEVSDLGHVRHVKRPHRNLAPFRINSGYLIHSLQRKALKKYWLVHRIVALAFLPAVHGKLFVNHINGDKTDNRLDNLEWCTKSENMLHAFRTGLAPHQHSPRPHCWRAVVASRNGKSLSFASLSDAASTLGISRTGISNALAGRASISGGYDWHYAV